MMVGRSAETAVWSRAARKMPKQMTASATQALFLLMVPPGASSTLPPAGRSPICGSPAVLDLYQFVPSGTDADHFHRHIRLLGDQVEVVTRLAGQVGQLANAADVFFPPGHGLINRAAMIKSGLMRREIDKVLALAVVGVLVHGADLDLVETGKHVQLGDGQAGEPVQPHRVLENDQIEPAAAPLAPGGGAVFVPLPDQLVAQLVGQLGGEGTLADTGGVSLTDAHDLVDHRRTDSGADTGRAGDGIGRSDKGIGAVVDIQQAALGALKKHLLATSERLVNDQ